MNDRELLEAAAKAAGFELCWFEVGDGDPDCDPGWYCTNDITLGCIWNPLTDDGDALRLAVKLNITVGFDTLQDGAIVYSSAEWHDEWDKGFRIMEWLLKDPCSATRRAIVRAAAQMGLQGG